MNLEKLKEKIKNSGYTLKHISRSLNLTDAGLRNKLNRKYKFTVEEASKLSNLLQLNDREKIEIFL